MYSTEKLCLQWKDFEKSISQTFQELRDENNFLDVSLVCEDFQTQAHKVILSASSPFFKKILKQNPHPHPMIYIKGVESKELQNIVNFIYTGQVSLEESDLGSFLSLAADLKVKGLSQSKDVFKIRNFKVVTEDEKGLKESKSGLSNSENKVLPEMKKKKKLTRRKRKVKPQKLKTQTVTTQVEMEKNETKDEKNRINTGNNVSSNQVKNVEKDQQHTEVNTNTDDDEHGNTGTAKDHKSIEYDSPIEPPTECLAEPILTNDEMTTSFTVENIPIKQSLYIEPNITTFKCNSPEAPIPKEQMTIASAIIPVSSHKRKYPVLEKRQQIIPEKKMKKDERATVNQCLDRSPKWQCYICARIFGTKDASITHLKEAHSIAKSKSGTFINSTNV